MIRQLPASMQLVVSPLSVIFALAMVQAGANGKTKMQINKVISKDASDAEIENFYSKLSGDVRKSNNELQARIANGLFLEQVVLFNACLPFMTIAKIQTLDFGQASRAAQIINGFVSEATEGKIGNIVTDDSIRDSTSFIINAIYFKGKWQYEFKKSSTSNATFHKSSNEQKQVSGDFWIIFIEFLNERKQYRYYTEDNSMQVLSLRYNDTSYALNFFLPKTR
ncbi:serine proteinase inhibitor [Oesophagostomum dentatum]|uniref:Serine proteinase inhibitor n=1 Tax=Oesophagostomum dentatum TaxID=61180 RepID=A0A0B1TIY4_OESDE|nr:serine proteinase inhibitor [Oesophagostomum dentatum]